MSVDNSRAGAELRRIRWRQRVLALPGGVAWLVSLIRLGSKERDLGPEKPLPPSLTGL
jgi:hypothetical protein